MSNVLFSSEASSNSLDLKSGVRIICRVCEKQFSQYTCPRCNIRYCSLHCYQSHSLRCTESFMRENVTGELQQTRPDEESRLKMLDILKRLHEQDEADNFDVYESGPSFSEETIEKVLSGSLISFDELSGEEKKCFQRAVASGELSKLIEPWDPWWLKPAARHISLSSNGTQLVQPMENDINSDLLHDIPSGPETPLSPVMKLTPVAPSPLLAIHLIDIIYSYCFTLRLYNGDWKADPCESSMVFLSMSSVLGDGAQPETVLEALLNCLEQTCSPAYKHIGGLQLGLRLVDDVIHILHLGGGALICLLCDLQRLIHAARKEVKLERRQRMRSSRLKSTDRKIYFLMCWVHEQACDVWSSLAAILNTEKASLSAHIGNSISKPDQKRDTQIKPMIREI